MALNDIQIADLPLIQDVNDEDLIIIHDVSLELTFKTTWDGLKNSIGTLVEGIIFPLGTPLEPSVAIGDYTSGIYGEDFGHFQIVTQGVDRIHVTPSGTQYLYNGNTVIGNLDEPCRWELDVYDISTFHCDVIFKGDVEFEQEIEFDDIIVNGNAIIKGDVELGTDCNNDIIIHGEITADCDMDLAGNINIGGNAIIDGDLIAGGNIDLGTDCNSTINLHGNATFDCDVNIDSNLNVGGNLVVEGNEIILGKPGGNCKPGDTNIDLNGDANIQCDTNIGGDLTVNGDATIGSGCGNSDITLDGATTIECDLTVNGENIIIGNPATGCSPGNVINLNGDTTISCDLTANGDISLGTDCNNAIDLHGDITGDCNMTIAGPEIILGTPGGTCDTIDLNGEVSIECGTTIGGDLDVQGSVDLGSGNCSTTPINIHGITTIDCNLTVNGEEVNLGNPNNPCVSNIINLHGETNIDCDTNVSGNLNVDGDSSLGTDCGNNVDINAELLAHCNITGDKDLNLLGDANIGTDLIVGGNTTLGSGCSPTSNTIINSTLDVKCDTTIDGDLTVDGNIESVNGIFIGDGQGLINLNIPASMTFMGDIDISQSPTSQGITNPKTGDFYLNNNGDGTTPAKNAHPDWVGISGVSVTLNRHVIYTVENKWILGSTMDVSGYVTLGTFQTITESKIFEKNITVGTDSSNLALFKSEIIGNENVRFDKDLVVKQNTTLGSGCTNTLIIDATTTALCDFTINGSLDVGRSVDITDDLVVGGNTTLGSGCGVSTLTVDSATSFKCGVDIGIPGSCTGMLNVYSPQTNHCDVIMRKDLLIEGDTEMEGYLEVDGNITGHSNLVIDKNATIGSGCSNLTTLNSKLDVKCEANIDGDLTANGSVDLGSGGCSTTPINLHGETTIDCDLDVKQDTNIDGSLNVDGSVDLGSGDCTTTPINIHGVVNIDCNTTVGGNLQVDGNGNIDGNLGVDGNITGGGNLDITGSVDLGSGDCTTTPINIHGVTTIDCDTNVGGNLQVDKNTNIDGNLTADGTIELGSGGCSTTPINIHGHINADCDLNLDGTGNIGGDLNLNGTGNIGGDLNVDGSVDLGKGGCGDTPVNIHGVVNIDCNTNVGGNLNVDGNGTIDGNLGVDGNITGGGNLDISGSVDLGSGGCGDTPVNIHGVTNIDCNTNVGGNLNVDGSVDLGKGGCGDTPVNIHGHINADCDLNLDGNGNIGGKLDVDGNITGGGNITIDGNGTIDGNLGVDGNITGGGNITIDGNVVLGKPGDCNQDIQINGDTTINCETTINDDLNVNGDINIKPGNVFDGQLKHKLIAGDYIITKVADNFYNNTAQRTFHVDGTTAATANKVAVRNGNADLLVRYIQNNHGRTERKTDDTFYSTRSDNFVRKNTAQGMRDSLDILTQGETDALIGKGTLTITGRNALNGSVVFSANEFTNKSINLDVKHDNVTIKRNGSDQLFVDTSNLGVGDGQINFNAGNGLSQTGSNATANQSGNTTKTFSIKRPTGGGGLNLDGNGIAVKPVTLWGQTHDHTGNVSGDMTKVKSITGANAPLDIEANDGNVNWGIRIKGNATGSNVYVGSLDRTGYIEFQSGQINGYRFWSRGSNRGVLDFENLTGDRVFRYPDKTGNIALLNDIKNSQITVKINGISKQFTLNQSTNQTLNFGDVSGGGGGGSGGGAPTPVLLWGQDHDHTGDVSGDMSKVKSITGDDASLIIKPKDGNGNHDLKLEGNDQGSNVVIGNGSKAGSIQFYSSSSSGFRFFSSTNQRAILKFESLSAGRTFTFQDKAGTLAHLDDINDNNISIKINGVTKNFTLNQNTDKTLDFGTITGGGGGGGTPSSVTLWGQPHDHTGNVSGDMTGVKSITGGGSPLLIKPKDGNGNHDLKLEGNAEGSNVVIGNGSTNGAIVFSTGNTNGFRFFNTSNQRSILNFESLSANRTFTFQDKAGTLAHLDDISNETITIDVNGNKQSFTLNGSSKTLSFTLSTGSSSLWEEVANTDGTTGIRPASGTYTSVVPRNNTTSLGLPDKRWSDVWTNDLHLSNEGKTNDVDGTWGDWTIQEGEDELYLINNRSGKKFAFMLRPVN